MISDQISDVRRDFMATFFARLEGLLAVGVEHRMDVAVQMFDGTNQRGAKAILIAPGGEMPGPGAWTVYHSSRGLPRHD